MSTPAGPQPSPTDRDPANRPEDRPQVRTNPADGASSFTWEFPGDPHSTGLPPTARPPQPAPPNPDQKAAQPVSPLPRTRQPKAPGHARTPHFSPARANYIRHQLNLALDQWWVVSRVPAPTLLRDALLLLESGEPLEEGHRTLLLRAALAHGRGIHTALKHQTDPERVGLVVAESLLDWQPPLHLEGPDIQAALGHPDVIAALIRELRRRLRESSPSGKTQVGALLGQLAQPVQHIPPSVSLDRRRDLHRPLRRTLFVGLIIATLAFFLVQYRTTHPAEMVLLPGGRYTSAPSSNLDRRVTVEVESIFVDRFEATNREYRACISRGACPWPTRSDSATHSAYLTNPAFADFPVVHVTLHAATAYCAWQGKRLPTAAEWMAAAGGAPTQQIHRFPWGEQFDPQRANSAETARGDTVPIGTFRPGGNSPIGASDLAGNVAEWTTTQSAAGVTHSVTNSVSGNTIENIIKGGSFADERTALQITTEQFFPADQSAPWLGFRCVRTARSPR